MYIIYPLYPIAQSNRVYRTCRDCKRRNNSHNGLRDDRFARALFEKLNMKLIMTLFGGTGI